MIAKDLISDIVPVLRESDTGLQSLNWMEAFKVSHLPVVRGNTFIGLLSDNDIYDLNCTDQPIGKQKMTWPSPFVTDNQHVYDVVEKISQLKLTVIPVLLEHDKTYLGLITLSKLMQYVDKIFAASQPGSIIVLELNSIDYSLSEIAQIIEGNDAKILSLHINASTTSRKIELTIKVNKTNLTAILQTFQRYNYFIKSTYFKDDNVQDLLFDRYKSFMKILNT